MVLEVSDVLSCIKDDVGIGYVCQTTVNEILDIVVGIAYAKCDDSFWHFRGHWLRWIVARAPERVHPLPLVKIPFGERAAAIHIVQEHLRRTIAFERVPPMRALDS